MFEPIPAGDSPAARRAYSAAELMLDRQIHRVGVAAGLLGAAWLVAVAAISGGGPYLILSILAYAAGLVAMLGCSAAYHLTPVSPRRDLLRRFDHAAIFVMIAGTYTPFTVNRLTGTWSIAMTSVIWAIALAGAAIKLLRRAASVGFRSGSIWRSAGSGSSP